MVVVVSNFVCGIFGDDFTAIFDRPGKGNEEGNAEAVCWDWRGRISGWCYADLSGVAGKSDRNCTKESAYRVFDGSALGRNGFGLCRGDVCGNIHHSSPHAVDGVQQAGAQRRKCEVSDCRDPSILCGLSLEQRGFFFFGGDSVSLYWMLWSGCHVVHRETLSWKTADVVKQKYHVPELVPAADAFCRTMDRSAC